jgi:hypothetical protein
VRQAREGLGQPQRREGLRRGSLLLDRASREIGRHSFYSTHIYDGFAVYAHWRLGEMEFVFDLLRSSASVTPSLGLEDTPLISLYSDPFEGSEESPSATELIIRKTNLLVNSPQPFFVRRVYLRTLNFLEYRYVGWVLDDDVILCMICSSEFSLFLRRHHCRICGDLVCDSCSDQTIVITERRDCGPVRVCNCCYYGQVGSPVSCFVFPSLVPRSLRKKLL